MPVILKLKRLLREVRRADAYARRWQIETARRINAAEIERLERSATEQALRETSADIAKRIESRAKAWMHA